MKEIFGFEAFAPEKIAENIQNIGVKKAKLPVLSTLLLGILAGAFIGLGAMFYVVITSDKTMSFALSRLLGGGVFSLGLIMVVIAGAELFTGNNLLVMAWAGGYVNFKQLLKNWGLVLIANFIGAIGLVILIFLSGHTNLHGGAVADNYIKIAAAKCQLSFSNAFFSGILCNVLVCLAVWMAQAGRTVTDKILAIVFPVSAFVAAGFEHSIANMYLIPMAIFVKAQNTMVSYSDAISWIGFTNNLLPVILGNIVGGGVFVSLIYFIIYGRNNTGSQAKI